MEIQLSQRSDAQVVAIARALWWALFISLFMYVWIGFQMERQMPPGGALPRLELILKICAAALFFFAYLIPRLWARRRALRHSRDGVPPLSEKFPPYLLRLALFDAVVLLGLVLAARTSTGAKLWPFLILSSIGFLQSFPTRRRLETL